MAFVNCPVELLKVKLQTQYGPSTGATVVKAVIKGEAEAGVIKPVSGFRRGKGGRRDSVPQEALD